MGSLFRNLLLLVLMLAASGLALALRPTQKIADQAERIHLETMIPARLDGWQVDTTIIPLQPPPDLQAVIAETYDQTLARTYVNGAGERIMLSLAYGGAQREDMNTHRPEVCYPAQGFQLRSTRPDRLPVLGRELPLHRVVASLGNRYEPITYWVVVGDELTEFGLRHKLTTLKYGLTGRIPDGMLIRVSSIDRDEGHAFQLQDQFIQSMLAALTAKDQVRLLGALPH